VTIGEHIKRIRKEKGLTQKKLGELCGINEVQIRQYELGKANPKIETVNKVAIALEVPISEFFEFKKDKTLQRIVEAFPNSRITDITDGTSINIVQKTNNMTIEELKEYNKQKFIEQYDTLNRAGTDTLHTVMQTFQYLNDKGIHEVGSRAIELTSVEKYKKKPNK